MSLKESKKMLWNLECFESLDALGLGSISYLVFLAVIIKDLDYSCISSYFYFPDNIDFLLIAHVAVNICNAVSISDSQREDHLNVMPGLCNLKMQYTG